MCYREGLQARQCNVTGVLGARGSAHCALGFKPSLCPACHGRCVLLHRQRAGLPPLPADSLLPSCGHLNLVEINWFTHGYNLYHGFSHTVRVVQENIFINVLYINIFCVFSHYCKNGPPAHCLYV